MNALEALVRSHFPEMEVIAAYAYPWNFEDEADGGEKIVLEAYEGSTTAGGNMTALQNTARGTWKEMLAYRLTYCRPVNSQKKSEIDLAAATAEDIFPIFRKRILDGVDSLHISTERLQPYIRKLVNGNGLFVVPFVVTYRKDSMETRA